MGALVAEKTNAIGAARRPLRELIAEIKEEIRLGREAGLEHYRRAGAALLEARAEVERGDWGKWLKANFKVNASTAHEWMILAKKYPIAIPISASRKTMTQITRPDADRDRAAWPEPVRLAVRKVDVEKLSQEEQARAEEKKLTRELAHNLIEIGFKALALKLHPDRGGSREGMARLNRVRDLLRRAV